MLTEYFFVSIQALEKANQAKSISADSTVKVREAIASVNEILIALNNMGSIGMKFCSLNDSPSWI